MNCTTMSTSNPKRTIVQRLEIDQKNKGHDYEISGRRWSAESGKDIYGVKQRYVRKSTSPNHLPRLKTPPEWPRQYGDLKRGKLTVVPPVKTREAFVGQSSAHATKEKVEVHSKPSYYNQQQQQNVMNSMSGFPVVPPPLYGQPIQNGPFITSNSALPYPSGVYPVPVYMSYAPVLLPPIQNPMGYPMGVVANQLNQTFLTRDEAATCIQKYFRGWRVRKDSRLLQLRFLSHPGSAKRFIEDLISEFLDEDIVPDILIEVLSHKKSLSPYDPLYKMSSYLCSDILHDEVNVLLNQIAASVFYSQVDLGISSESKKQAIEYAPGFLRMVAARIDLRRTDPLFQVCQELTDEVVKEMALMTVQSTIKSLVNSHMAFSKSFDWLDDLIIETIQPMIYNVAVTSLSAYKYETTLDEIVDEVTNDMMQPVIVEAWKEVIDSHRDTQITEIARFSEGRLLDSLVLEHLLSHLTGNNLSLYFRDYMEQTMDGFICGALLHQYMLVHDASEDTLSNRALQNYHQESYADMALDVILDELCGHLDEDMQDLLNKEKLDAHAVV